MRKAITAALAAGVLVSTAACSSDDSSSDSDAKAAADTDEQGGGSEGGGLAAALLASQEKSAEASTVAVTSTMSMDLPEGMAFSYELSGVTGWDPLAMDVTMDMTEFFEAMAEMMGDDSGEVPEAVMNLRFIDNVMYMGGTPFEEELDGASWVKIDLEDVDPNDPTFAQTAEQLKSAENMAQSPASQVALLLESDDVEHVGSEDLDGRATEKYAGTLTAEELVAADASAAHMNEADIEDLLTTLEQMGADGFELTVWVDEDDLPARVDMRFAVEEGGEVSYSTVYEDYGIELNVEAPDEADVVDFADARGAGL
ncbi:hypothetical protein [Streptomyces lonarensis]|uniref:Lipoprotein n=1 Tax=Streptomyces lonarensis TaxID=700599 RepID=A0A7X6D0K3_9ACTN|nr:hypothetical protein [Streptomyces lonarensis]NJQ05884.1 hypothetical protein [Streptomyces lonarensis]